MTSSETEKDAPTGTFQRCASALKDAPSEASRFFSGNQQQRREEKQPLGQTSHQKKSL